MNNELKYSRGLGALLPAHSSVSAPGNESVFCTWESFCRAPTVSSALLCSGAASAPTPRTCLSGGAAALGLAIKSGAKAFSLSVALT